MNNVRLTTPVCTASWLHIFAPNTRYGSVYSITCDRDDSLAWTKLIATMTELYEDYYRQQCDLIRKKALKRCEAFPWKLDQEGRPVFFAKNKSEGMTKDGKKFTTKPRVIGPDQTDLVESDLKGSLANGTTVRVGFAVNLWRNDSQGVGISARLNLVQILAPKYYDSSSSFELERRPLDPSLFNVRRREGSMSGEEFLEGLEVDDLLRDGKSDF